MKIKFFKDIRLLVKVDCCHDSCKEDQEWEFDKDEEFEVAEVVFGKLTTYRAGKKTKLMRFADILLNQGNADYPDYIYMVPEDCFEIL